MIGLFAVILLGACGTTSVAPPETCALDFAAPLPAAPGDTVVLLGGPVTEVEDTKVLVGGVDATLVDVAREECTLCDACQIGAICTGCDDCAVCNESCATCIEKVTFVVPPVGPGTLSLVVINSWGSSTDLLLEVTSGSIDTDTTDTDANDTDGTDTDADTDTTAFRARRPPDFRAVALSAGP